MCLLLPLSLLMAVSLGATSLPLSELFGVGGDESRARMILEQIRLPRALLAAAVGAMLGICGATTQGLFRNPLADPSLIGVTAGASAGAAAMIFLAADFVALQGMLGVSIISLGAFIGGAIAVLFVYRIATGRDGTSVATMLLAGIAITAISGGFTSLIEFFADNEMLRRISLWRMGGLDGANATRVILALAFAALVIAVLPRFSTALNALLLGESEARHLGISVQKTKFAIVVVVALGVAVSVALAGTIAFVGLIVPHIIRLLIGPDHRYLLPMSAVGGASLLLMADTLSRTIVAPVELPVGLVTAFLGAPFFISLLRQRYRYGFN
jgi:iron complex transport system permease protein